MPPGTQHMNQKVFKALSWGAQAEESKKHVYECTYADEFTDSAKVLHIGCIVSASSDGELARKLGRDPLKSVITM